MQPEVTHQLSVVMTEEERKTEINKQKENRRYFDELVKGDYVSTSILDDEVWLVTRVNKKTISLELQTDAWYGHKIVFNADSYFLNAYIKSVSKIPIGIGSPRWQLLLTQGVNALGILKRVVLDILISNGWQPHVLDVDGKEHVVTRLSWRKNESIAIGFCLATAQCASSVSMAHITHILPLRPIYEKHRAGRMLVHVPIKNAAHQGSFDEGDYVQTKGQDEWQVFVLGDLLTSLMPHNIKWYGQTPSLFVRDSFFVKNVLQWSKQPTLDGNKRSFLSSFLQRGWIIGDEYEAIQMLEMIQSLKQKKIYPHILLEHDTDEYAVVYNEGDGGHDVHNYDIRDDGWTIPHVDVYNITKRVFVTKRFKSPIKRILPLDLVYRNKTWQELVQLNVQDHPLVAHLPDAHLPDAHLPNAQNDKEEQNPNDTRPKSYGKDEKNRESNDEKTPIEFNDSREYAQSISLDDASSFDSDDDIDHKRNETRYASASSSSS